MQIPEQFFSIQEQTWLFLGSCLLGLPIGLMLDGFRFLRVVFPHHWLTVFVEDCLLVLFSAMCLQCYAVVYARGQLRYMMAIGCFLGLMLYCSTIGAVWMRILQRFQSALQRVWGGFLCCACRIWQKMRSVFVRYSEKENDEGKMSKKT